MALPRYDPSAVQWRAVVARFGMLLPPFLLLLGALFVVVHARQDRALEALLQELGPRSAGDVPSTPWVERCRQLHGDLLWLFGVVAAFVALAAWAVARYAAQRDASSRRAFHAERLAAIGEAMTALAHESRNAIQRGQASIEMLAKRVRDLPEASKHLERLQDAQEDLHQLYERVRSYAAPVPLNRKVVDVREVLDAAFADLDAHSDTRQIRFEVRASAANTHAKIDPFAMRRAFRNVLENALSPENDGDAVREVVKIDVELGDTRFHGAPALAISIQDNGPGVPEGLTDRIFEPFFTTRSRGTGLGMAITRRILEMHGGRIALVEGTRPGACFVFTLPRDMS